MKDTFFIVKGAPTPTEDHDSPDPTTERNYDNDDEYDQVTSQAVIDSLPKYNVRKNGAYSKYACTCGLCQCKYIIGDRVVCLPCQHNFHEYCIENWLKWVKSSCPIDKKSIIRVEYLAELGNDQFKPKIQKYTLREETSQEGVNEVPETRKNKYSSPNDSRRSPLPVIVVSKKGQSGNSEIITSDGSVRKSSPVFNKTKRCGMRGNYCSESTASGMKLDDYIERSQNASIKSISSSPRSFKECKNTLNLKNCTTFTTRSNSRSNHFHRNQNSFSCKKFTTVIEQAEIGQKSNCRENLEHGSRSDERAILQKLIANKSATFTDALRMPIQEKVGWVYKSDMNEFLRKNCLSRK